MSKVAKNISLPSRQKKVHNGRPFIEKLEKKPIDNYPGLKKLPDYWGDELVL